jgi:hypothetical protein
VEQEDLGDGLAELGEEELALVHAIGFDVEDGALGVDEVEDEEGGAAGDEEQGGEHVDEDEVAADSEFLALPLDLVFGLAEHVDDEDDQGVEVEEAHDALDVQGEEHDEQDDDHLERCEEGRDDRFGHLQMGLDELVLVLEGEVEGQRGQGDLDDGAEEQPVDFGRVEHVGADDGHGHAVGEQEVSVAVLLSGLEGRTSRGRCTGRTRGRR